MDKFTGKRLDKRYEIHELIGVGGMAVVYKAYDTLEERVVAIKILKEEFSHDRDFLRRFKNECKAIDVLNHENIVKVYDISFGTKLQYIAMEYINGITLKEYLLTQKVLSWQDAIFFAKQILLGLEHAHSKGIIHRDIKPQNIMMLRDGSIKITDFGIARFFKNSTQTVTDKTIGSVHYIAPEQVRGSRIDERCDIYSLGTMLYEMLTGKLPFEGDNAVSIAIMQMQTRPKPLTEISAEIPKGLEEIVLHAMEKSVDRRYRSAREMLVDIEKFQNNPEARFEYKYLSDNSETKYVEAIDSIKKQNSDVENEKKASRKATIIASGIALAVALFAMIFLFANIFTSCGSAFARDIEVPDFIGMQADEVQQNKNYNFKWKVETVYDPTKVEGVVVDQIPPAGSKKVKEGSTVTLKVNSSGVMVPVPNINGMAEEIAKNKLQNAGLKSETIMVVDSEVEKGFVKSSDPQEGSKVTVNTTVKLYVSKGPEEPKTIVPDVINKNLEDARQAILANNLKVDKVTYEDSDRAKNVVLSINPLPSVSVPVGTSVRIVASSGNKREKTVDINVDLPKDYAGKVNLSVSVDNEEIIEKNIYPIDNSNYQFSVKGKSGKKTVNVRLDGKPYRVYEVDFDVSANNLKKIASYDFAVKNEEPANEPTPSNTEISDEEEQYPEENSTKESSAVDKSKKVSNKSRKNDGKVN